MPMDTDPMTGSDMDLLSCDRDPIHIPGSIQPHGILFAVDAADLRILQVSENCEARLGVPARDALLRGLTDVLGRRIVGPLSERLKALTHERRALFFPSQPRHEKRGADFHIIAHRIDGCVIVELEPINGSAEGVELDGHPQLDVFIGIADEASTVDELCDAACRQVFELTGFDRVLIYRFDEGWDGTVVAEAGNGRLPSYLHHRFPASDIPAQARELYRLNRLRMIPDASYTPSRIVPAVNPKTKRPLDLSCATLRSVSPVHLEYMRNMRTASSMSISILRGGRLWGLISCHHSKPKLTSFPIRAMCDTIARTFSLRLSAVERIQDFERRIETREAYARLLKVMSERLDFVPALAENTDDLLAIAEATGVAIVSGDDCVLRGRTPTPRQVKEIVDWLFQTIRQDNFSTASLASVYPPAREFTDLASGVLAIAISKIHASYVVWFRPEIVQTIKWGGDPNAKVIDAEDATRLHPRRSFETWIETVRGTAAPWRSSELEAANELRNAIVGTVLRRAEEIAELNAELTRSNKELEAFSYSVSHDLRAPLRHIVGYAEILKDGGAGTLSPRDLRCLDTIIESSEYAGRLVDKLLGFSRLGRAELQRVEVDLNVLSREVQKDVMRDAAGRRIDWRLGELPTVHADVMMLRMALRDLFSNAVKYTRNKEVAVIEVESREEGNEHVVSVRDNGVGFDMAYANKLFGVFQRLHRWEDYEGTGIGLANVRRVVERHGGRTWAEGEEGKGATFYFTLPKAAR